MANGYRRGRRARVSPRALWIAGLVALTVGSAGLQSPATAAAPSTEPTVYAVAPLRYLTAGRLAQMLGWRLQYLDAHGEVLPSPPKTTAGAPSDLLPPGLALLAAPSPEAHQVLLAGAPSAVAKTQEWLKQIDRKPQQVILEVALHTTTPKNAQPVTGTAPAGAQAPGKEVTHYDFPSTDQMTGSMRMATMNLLPALNITAIEDPSARMSRQELLCLTPRVNADGTITLSVSASLLETGAAALHGDSSAVVNVKSGESFLFGLPKAGQVAVITPTLLEEPGG